MMEGAMGADRTATKANFGATRKGPFLVYPDERESITFCRIASPFATLHS